MLQDDDALIEQQLRQESRSSIARAQGPAPLETMASAEEGQSGEEIASIVNELVPTPLAKHLVAGAGHMKRKRKEEAEVNEPRKKHATRGAATGEQEVATSKGAAGAAPAKLGRPKKAQAKLITAGEIPAVSALEYQQISRSTRSSAPKVSPTTTKKPSGKFEPRRSTSTRRRHMVEKYPGVTPIRKDGNVYDQFPHSSESKSVADKSIQKSKSTPKAKNPKNPARRVKNIPTIRDSTTAIEGHASAIFNGRVDGIGQPQGDSRKTRRSGESTGHTLASRSPVEDTGVKGKNAQRSNQSKKRAREASQQTRASEREKTKAGQSEATKGVEVQSNVEGESPVKSGDEGSDHEEPSQVHNDQNDNDGVSKSECDDDEEDQQNLDLLGEEKEWKKVLDAARSICGQRLLANKMPKLLTNTIKDLILHIKEARDLYERLLRFADMDHDQMDGLRAQVEDSLTAIKERVNDENISESKASPRQSEMIQDIYSRAIPALVLLLKDAFAFRARPPKGLHDYETLREIIDLQDMIIALCVKATRWKAKPLTDRPVINPTTRIIFPYVRSMRNRVFKNELAEQRRKWKNEQNASKTARREEEELEQSQRQRHGPLASTVPPACRIMEDIERNRIKWRSSRDTVGTSKREKSFGADAYADVQHTQSASRIEQPHTSAAWTDKETRVLFQQLEHEYISNQPGA